MFEQWLIDDKYMDVYTLGDIHGDFKTLIYNITQRKYLTNSAFIICGDCGFGFHKYKSYLDEFTKLNEKLKERNCIIYFVRGNHDCLSKDTLVLTKRGWLSYNELNLNDYVLSFNSDNRKSQWEKIDDIIIKNSDFIYENKCRSFSMSVTENHRHLLYDSGKFLYKKTNEILNVKNAKFKVIHFAELDDTNISNCIGLKGNVISDDEIRLVAWIMTDGYIDNKKWNYYSISQSKENGINKIRTILNNLGYSYTESVRKRGNENLTINNKKIISAKDEHIFRIHSESSKYIYENLLNDKFKLPSWVYNLTSRQMKIFAETLIDANGSYYTNEHRKNCNILYGKKEQLVQFIPIFSMCGHRCTLSKSTRGDWRLNICKTQYSNIINKSHNFIKCEYNDTVFCLTTKLSNFYVYRNGTCYFTGNCKKYFDEKLINFETLKTVPDYTILSTSQNKHILCVGGGISIDRKWRMQREIIMNLHNPNPSEHKRLYWEDEQVVYDEDKLNEILSSKIPITNIVTHSCPSFCPPTDKDNILSWLSIDDKLEEDLKIERENLDKLASFINKNYPNKDKKNNYNIVWCYGHFHQLDYKYFGTNIYKNIQYVFMPMMNSPYDEFSLHCIQKTENDRNTIRKIPSTFEIVDDGQDRLFNY